MYIWCKYTAVYIARKGEELVANLLPESNWVNRERESYLPYDIIWKDTKIDVKTTFQYSPGCTNAHAFRAPTRREDITIVMVAMIDGMGKPLFWVENHPNQYSYYKKGYLHTWYNQAGSLTC